MSMRRGEHGPLRRGEDLFAAATLSLITTRPRVIRTPRLLIFLLLVVVGSGCALSASRGGIPQEARDAIDVVSNDILEGRYDKIYNEASEQWRDAASSEQSNAIFKTLKDKLGNVKNRSLHSATEQSNASGQLSGHSFNITYQTTFERGEGMETFTLIERDGRWLLARYFVNSDALKP